MLKIIRYLAESILAKSAYWVFRLLPFNVASSMGDSRRVSRTRLASALSAFSFPVQCVPLALP
ncbi:MAG: hypothetical protein ACE1ZG_03550, partial [Gammaproteobacteria bacterium]